MAFTLKIRPEISGSDRVDLEKIREEYFERGHLIRNPGECSDYNKIVGFHDQIGVLLRIVDTLSNRLEELSLNLSDLQFPKSGAGTVDFIVLPTGVETKKKWVTIRGKKVRVYSGRKQ